MLPKQPPRDGQPGFLYLPPYRVHGISVAGEHTTITIPEFDLTFDMGLCTKASLSTPLVALTHTHMDHVAALPYWFSQRHFQKLEGGRVVCHPDVVEPLRAMLSAWVPVERQRTPFQVDAIAPGESIPIRQGIDLHALETRHTCPSLGFSIVENRRKLKAEYQNLPQSRLREIRATGEEITYGTRIPLVSYTGDTVRTEALEEENFVKSRIVVCECTFLDPDHRGRANVGRHLHLDDVAELLGVWEAEHVVLVHMSRRTMVSDARERLKELGVDGERVHILMDHRANRKRYEQQKAETQNSSGVNAENPGTSAESQSSGEVDSGG